MIDIEESINASDSFLAEKYAPKGTSNNDQSETYPKNTQSTPSCHTSYLTPNITSKKVLTPSRLNTVNESETFIDDMYEKTRTLNLKKEIVSELQLILKLILTKSYSPLKITARN